MTENENKKALIEVQGNYIKPSEYAMIKDQAKLLLLSALRPAHLEKIEDTIIVMLTGRAMNLEPIVACSEISVIKGRASPSSKLMLARVDQVYPEADYYFEKTSTTECVIKAKKKPHHPYTEFKMTWEDVERAGLNKGKKDRQGKNMYDKYPAQMLRARCIANMVRAVFPMASIGMAYVPEETAFFENPKQLSREKRERIKKYDPNNILSVDFDEITIENDSYVKDGSLNLEFIQLQQKNGVSDRDIRQKAYGEAKEKGILPKNSLFGDFRKMIDVILKPQSEVKDIPKKKEIKKTNKVDVIIENVENDFESAEDRLESQIKKDWERDKENAPFNKMGFEQYRKFYIQDENSKNGND